MFWFDRADKRAVFVDKRRETLTAFIGGSLDGVYRTLDKTEQSRLNRQLEAMTLYSNILGERIAAFVA
jgi:hypothetical protein